MTINVFIVIGNIEILNLTGLTVNKLYVINRFYATYRFGSITEEI